MKLDNRPKTLIVKGAKEDSTQAVRDWYEVSIICSFPSFAFLTVSQTTGQVDSLTTVDNGDIVVTFRTRSGAEQVRLFTHGNCYIYLFVTLQGLAKGHNISLVGPVQVAWHTGPAVSLNAVPASAPPKRTPAVNSETDSAAQTVDSHMQDAPPSPGALVQEEEVASGWGDGDEDGMGML
jgi:RNA-binding protein 26